MRRILRPTFLVSAVVLAGLCRCEAAADSAGWKIELVDHSGMGQFSSLKIDKEGNAHVAYAAEDSQSSLKYAFWDHAIKRWFTMNVATGAEFCSLTLDSKQRPHISYVDRGTPKGARVRYARWDGTAWQLQGIPHVNAGAFGFYTSIALDPKDNPTISFYDYAGPGGDFILRLRTFTWNGKYWEARTVDPEYGSGKFNSIAADSTGTMHLAYANVSAMRASLRYARWNGTSWDLAVLEGASAANPFYSVNMVLDKQNVPHITYTDMERNIVKYATLRGGSWVFRAVDTLGRGSYPDRNGIALDSEGNPYISYYDLRSGVLKLAHLKNDKWITETVDENFAGFTSSLQIANGSIWITYADEPGAAIKCARRALDQTGAVVSESAAR
jgi:hypothetical protein